MNSYSMNPNQSEI